MTENQLLIKFSSSVIMQGKPKTAKSDSAEKFCDILLSAMPDGDGCGIDSIYNRISDGNTSGDILIDTLSTGKLFTINGSNDNADILPENVSEDVDDNEVSYELFAPGTSLNITEYIAIGSEKLTDRTVAEKLGMLDLSEGNKPTTNTANTTSPILAYSGFGFADTREAIGGEAGLEAVHINREQINDIRAAEQNLTASSVEILGNAGGKDVMPAGQNYAEPNASVNIFAEKSVDGKSSDLIGGNYTGLTFSPKSESDSDDLKNIPETSDSNLKAEDLLSVANFKTTIGVDYTGITKAEKIDLPSVRNDTDIVNQLSDGIKIGAEKSDSSLFSLKLKPDGLGEVMIKLSRKPDRLEVEISAELTSTKELISKELESLRIRLNSDIDGKPYQFATVKVEYEAYGANASFSGGQSGRGGYNGNYGGAGGYQAKTDTDDKMDKNGGVRYKNRLIDCSA